MVSKTLAAVVALAMIAGTAQASMQLEHFLTFANDPTASNFKLMVFYQLWAFLVPLAAGPINVFLYYLWNEMSQDIDLNGETLSVSYAQALGFAGFGNYDQLMEIFLGIAPKILIKTFIGFSLLDADADPGYGSLEQELLCTMSLAETASCDECSCD